MRIIHFKFPKIGELEVRIFNESLAEFALRQLSNYAIISSFMPEKSQLRTEIRSSNSSVLEAFGGFFSQDMEIARKLKVANNKLQNKECLYELSDGSLNITGFRKARKRKWYRLFREKKMSYAELHDLFYRLVLFPIFSLYTLADGYYLIHGSLVEIDGKHKLILGLDGVGKSTISERLGSIGGRILADNFVLFNGSRAMPFNMAMRLAVGQETDLDVIYEDDNLREVRPRAVVYESVEPVSAFILTIGGSYLNRIDRSSGRLELFLNNAPEIGVANDFLAPFLFRSFGFHIEPNRKLNFFTLSIPRGEIDKFLEKIREY